MKAEAKSELAKIISDYDDKLAEAERVGAAKRAEHAAFPERFVILSTEIIKPTAQEIADMLNARGHSASIREQDESPTVEGRVKHAAVSLHVVPKPFAHKAAETNASSVEVTFSANRSERKVTVSSTNTMLNHAGTVGKLGEYEIDAVTADVVARHVTQTLNDAFRGAR
jgi:hypothetical protein